MICFCGRSLGDIYDAFKALRLKRYSEFLDSKGIKISPDRIPITEDIQIDLRDVFESLHIHVQCCKVRLLTETEFKEYY